MANSSEKHSGKLQKKSEAIKSPVRVRSGRAIVGSRAQISDLQKQLSVLKDDFDVVISEREYLQEKLATVVKKIFENTDLPESTQLMIDTNNNTLDQFPLNVILEALSTLITGKLAIEKDSLAAKIEDLETRVTQQSHAIGILVTERLAIKNDLDHLDVAADLTEVKGGISQLQTRVLLSEKVCSLIAAPEPTVHSKLPTPVLSPTAEGDACQCDEAKNRQLRVPSQRLRGETHIRKMDVPLREYLIEQLSHCKRNGADWRMLAERVGISSDMVEYWTISHVKRPMELVLIEWGKSSAATMRMLYRHLRSPQMKCVILSKWLSSYYEVD